jgi:hypothetical protein
MQSKNVNYFITAAMGNTENHSDTSTEEEDDAVQEEWVQQSNKMDVNFSS